jgi:hypothetical protein
MTVSNHAARRCPVRDDLVQQHRAVGIWRSGRREGKELGFRARELLEREVPAVPQLSQPCELIGQTHLDTASTTPVICQER